MEEATGLNIGKKISDALGVCQETNKVSEGVLSQGTWHQIKKSMIDVLRKEGIPYQESAMLTNQIIQDCGHIWHQDTKMLNTDIKEFFRVLKKAGIKIVITAADDRENILKELQNLGVMKYVDLLLCDNDPYYINGKHNIELICEEFKVDPSKAVLVGDATSDFANIDITKRIGVLTGVSSKQDLESHTDVVVDSVDDVLKHVFDESSMKTITTNIYDSSKSTESVSSYSTEPKQDAAGSAQSSKRLIIDLEQGMPSAGSAQAPKRLTLDLEQCTPAVGSAQSPKKLTIDSEQGMPAAGSAQSSKILTIESEQGISAAGPAESSKRPSVGMSAGPFSKIKRTFSSIAFRHYSTRSNLTGVYDYVIVGAGSAGCVLTNRLSAKEENKVLVLEAGPKDYTWKIHMPAALMYNLCNDKYNWYYHTEPEPGMNNRVMYWPRGRVWGGSSSLNAMVYIRGNALDYDNWEKLGAKSWSYADCLPYFKKSQCHELGENDYRGGNGPLHVSRGKSKNPLFKAFIDAGMQAGYPFTDDMNGYQQEGVGWMDMTINKGIRWSAASAYLRPAMKRKNVTAEVKACTRKILFDRNRAVGVEFEQGGVVKKALANKEVILSGGSINSPQLLMLSGIGSADELRKLDIPVIQHLPGVGENLQDHLEVYIQYEITQPLSLYKAQWKFPHNMIKIGLQWFTSQKGDGATAHLEAGGFIRSRPGVEWPDIQYHFLPSTVNDHGRKMGDRHACQVHVGTLRPTSRGYVKLKTKNFKDHPRIVANYLSTQQDIEDMRACVRLSREIFGQKAFEPFLGPEINPGENVKTDAEIDDYVRRMGDSAYHPSCTCKMGSLDDKMTVVDSETKVLGVEGLRVVDASIMPAMVSGNLNGPTIMVAEKAADIILGNKPLPKSYAPVFRPKSLETQR